MKSHSHISRFRSLSEKGWLSLLADPQTEIRLDLQGLQGRLEPGSGWDTQTIHIHQHLIYFFSEGQCSAVIAEKRIPIAAGSVCWICPKTNFRFFHGTGDRSPVVYRFRFLATRRGVSYKPKGHFRFAAQAWPLFELVRQLVLEADRESTYGHWRKQSLVALLSIGIFETKPLNRNETLFDDAQRMAISAFLAEQPPARQTPADLAHHLGFSHDYFSRIFRRSYGVSPRTWLLRQRLAHAAVLLRESTRRISEIAERLGYAELYLFRRQFRQAYGASPRQWRSASGLERRQQI